MRVEIWDIVDGKHQRVDELAAEPECGRDFCDKCGDCLYCYSEDCNSHDYCGLARWVLYVGDDVDLIAELRQR